MIDDTPETCPGCGNVYGLENLCMPSACQWEGIKRPASAQPPAAEAELTERIAGAAYERQMKLGDTPWESVVKRNWAYQQDIYDHWCEIARAVLEILPPPTTASTAAEVETMARELHTLLRNGKEFPYADGEERRYYELVVTRWLEKLPRQDTAAEVLAGLVAEMRAMITQEFDGTNACDVRYGIDEAIALVEAAQRRLVDDERGRGHG